MIPVLDGFWRVSMQRFGKDVIRSRQLNTVFSAEPNAHDVSELGAELTALDCPQLS